MKYELDKMMDLIKDYKTGYGGVTDSFMRKELEMFAKDYHSEQCNIANVVGQSELLPNECVEHWDKPYYCKSELGRCKKCS